jgi:hypothetical protein
MGVKTKILWLQMLSLWFFCGVFVIFIWFFYGFYGFYVVLFYGLCRFMTNFMWVVTDILNISLNYENMHLVEQEKISFIHNASIIVVHNQCLCVNGLGFTLHVSVHVKNIYLYDFTLLCETM